MTVMPRQELPPAYYATLDDASTLIVFGTDTWDPQSGSCNAFGKEWRLPRLSIGRGNQVSLSIAVYCPGDGHMSALAAQFDPPARDNEAWTPVAGTTAFVAAPNFRISHSSVGYGVNVNDTGALTQVALFIQRDAGFSLGLVAAIHLRGRLDPNGFIPVQPGDHR